MVTVPFGGGVEAKQVIKEQSPIGQSRQSVVKRGLFELGLDTFSFGRINHGYQNSLSPKGANRIDAHLHREFSTIFAQSVKFAVVVHQTNIGAAKKTLALAWVPITEALGQQFFNRLADEFASCVAKLLFDLGIHQADSSSPVYDQDAVGRRFHSHLKLFLSPSAFADLSLECVAQTGDLLASLA